MTPFVAALAALSALGSPLAAQHAGMPPFKAIPLTAPAEPDAISLGPMNRIAVPANAPPMFAALAMDDGLFGRQGYGVVEAWHAAGRPVELHVYERGDHGFGMGRPGTTTTLLMDEFYAWMTARGLLAK